MGQPRDHHRYDHAHESPKVMTVPLMICAFFAITVAWTPWGFGVGLEHLSLSNLLEQARPLGTLGDTYGVVAPITIPDEHGSHVLAVKVPVTLLAFGTAVGGIGLAACFYWFGYLDPADARRQFSRAYNFLLNKWWFDELYDYLFVKPAHVVSGIVAWFDRSWIDWFIDGTAKCTRWFSNQFEFFADRGLVDGVANAIARFTYDTGLSLRNMQTGRLRQYVMFIVIGVFAVVLLVSLFWSSSMAR